MKKYEINRNTQAIFPKERGGKLGSLIMETDHEFFVDMTPIDIIKRSCEYFGSSYSGRQKGTTSLLGISHKAPVIIEELNSLIFFPTTSPRLDECIWISHNHINMYHKDNYDSIIKFKNNKSINIPVSIGVLENQVLRSSRLAIVLLDRKQTV